MAKKSLLEIHEDVPADHYDRGIKVNLFQKYWHHKRFSEVLKAIEPVNNNPVLDVGCHSGTFTLNNLPKLKTKKIHGIDVSPSAIKLISKKIPYGHFEVADATKLPFKNNQFSAVFCLEMLEHVDDPVAVLFEIKRVLKKGGYTVILVPSDNRLFKIVWFVWTMYYSHWRHAHVQSFTSDQLDRLIKKLGFKITVNKTFNLGMLKLIVARK